MSYYQCHIKGWAYSSPFKWSRHLSPTKEGKFRFSPGQFKVGLQPSFLGQGDPTMVAMHLQQFPDEEQCLDPFKSAFWPCYDMETALVALVDDLRRRLHGGVWPCWSSAGTFPSVPCLLSGMLFRSFCQPKKLGWWASGRGLCRWWPLCYGALYHLRPT